MMALSRDTRQRVLRTLWQTLAGGTLTGVLVSYFMDDMRALVAALATAVGTVLATWAQNVLEDLEKIRDRRVR